MVSLKYLSNFWGSLEIPLIHCEISLFVTRSANRFIMPGSIENQVPTFANTDTKLYVPAVTLLTHDNAKLIQQLKSGFERTIKLNRYQSKAKTQTQSRYLDFLTDPSFQGVNRLFALSFENDAHQKSYMQYFPPTIEIKDYNLKIDAKNVLISQ